MARVFPCLIGRSYQASKNVPRDFVLRRTETPNDLLRLVGNRTGQLTNSLVARMRQRAFGLTRPELCKSEL